MGKIFKSYVHYISTKFPSIFLKYLRAKLQTSELEKTSIYKIAKIAHQTTNLDDLYKAIHESISNLMYAENIFFAILDDKQESISLPYYIDKHDEFQGRVMEYDNKSLTHHCLEKGKSMLLNKKEIIDFTSSHGWNEKEENYGTIPEYWLGCPLGTDGDKIGAIVVQSYEKYNKITPEDRDLLGFVSELLAIVLVNKRLEAERLEYQSNLEKKIEERTKELFYAKEKAEQATKTKSEFLANMSHELRTPLNAIIGFCEILIEDATEMKQESFVNDLNKIHKSGKHLLDLINDILDLSKIEAKKMDINIKSFIMQDLVRGAVDTLEPYAKINKNSIEYTLPEKPIDVTSDESKIRQILFNLVSNACKHSEESTITVDINVEKNNNVYMLTCKVIDAGSGIPADKLKDIFDPFKQAGRTDTSKVKSTGLGLAISKAYVELLGGSIHVKSKVGEGSIFTFKVLQNHREGVEDKAEKVLESATGISSNSINGGKVLVIDDDIIFLDLLNTRLSKQGYSVHTANSGEKGLQKAKKLLPDIIILDIVMPDIDGWTVYKKIKSTKLLSEIPIIVTTIGDYEHMAKDFGVVDFLSKPIEWNTLSKMLSKHENLNQSRYILVVDDDSTTREILRKMLIKDGWRVNEADHGKNAIKHLENEIPELILLDLLMPIMDGFKFLQELKKKTEWAKIPVIVITSKDLTEDDISFLSESADNVIQKGRYTRDELIKQIDSIIKENNLLKKAEKGR